MSVRQAKFTVLEKKKQAPIPRACFFSFDQLDFIQHTLDLIVILMIVGHTFANYLYRIEIYQPDYIVANWADVIGRMVNH